MKFQLLKKQNNNDLIAFKPSDDLLTMFIHVKMPTVVGIFTFMSINFMLSEA